MTLPLVPKNMGLPPEEVEARVKHAVEMTGTEHLLNRLPHHLSGGEKQMVAIAGLLAMMPRVILYERTHGQSGSANETAADPLSAGVFGKRY